ncbi:MAG: VWA domain-containing protein, partial [Vicinamibacterales bacterium]|nr:VWA domain-containing protein [Vicinamibacterales bacterium]
MDLLVELGRVLGFSFAAGINLYATVALLGLAARFGWVVLPEQYQAFNSDWVIGIAIALYVIEFLADKIPWLDSVWDAIHSFIRPVGGAAIAVIALGPSSPTLTAAAALVGGLVAGSTHVTKAGTRVMANASPEPFSNWALSLGEDVFVVALGGIALTYPLVALGVTVVLLVLIVVFAAAIVRAFRRRFGRRPASPGGRTAAGAITAVLIAAAMVGVSAWDPGPEGPGLRTDGPGLPTFGQGQQPTAQPQQPPRPVFRAGANFVRVDVYATKDGQAVTDLKAEDFEILEDGVAQKVETFEHVRISTGGVPAARVEPRTILESREMAADPRARVFVIFLDTLHMNMEAGYNVRRPLVNLLQRVIGDEDLVAIMKPDMSARDIMFTRRTDRMAAMLQSVLPLTIGVRDRMLKEDPVEQLYESCYGTDSGIAQAMIERRREKQSLDALLDLVRHLDGLREERKAILLVSQGYLLYRENRAMAEIAAPRQPGIGVGPTGRLGTTDRNNPYSGMQNQCDQDRVMLSQLDNFYRFRELLDEANRANATFYPVDPRGLAVFDTDMGPKPPPPVDVDFAMVRTRLDSLQTAAANTDGVAVINSNNIDAGLSRVVADLTSYYLIGYASTNAKLDGRFRSIRVRAKRPGIEIRARRGYQAATEAEVAARAVAEAPRVVDEATAAVERAVGSLANIRPNAPFRLQVSAGWWTAPGQPLAGKPAGAEPAFWIYGTVDVRRPGGDDWSKGGEAEVAILSDKGAVVTTFAVPVAGTTGAFSTRFPRNADDVWLDPGAYAVRVRVKPVTGGLPTMDTARFEVPKPADAGALLLGTPLYARRGQATGNKDVMTADLQFRRTERLIVEA